MQKKAAASPVDLTPNSFKMLAMKAWPLLPTLVALSGCVTLEEVHEHPHHPQNTPSAAVAPTQDLSKLMLGTWSFPQLAPDVSPVAVYFNADSTYALESEASIFEKGRWTLQGNRILMIPSKGKPSRATLQVRSQNELIWTSTGKKPLSLTRL